MLTSVRLGFLLAAGLALAACAKSYTPPEDTGALPPPAAVDEGAGVEAPPAVSLPEVAVAEPGAAPAASASEGRAAAGIVVKGPDGSLWQGGEDDARRKADTEACYDYALAETRHDLRIQSDADAARDTLATSSRFSEIRDLQNLHDFRRRRDRLMTHCMENRGYLRLETFWDTALEPFKAGE